jgi:hypothetical protein
VPFPAPGGPNRIIFINVSRVLMREWRPFSAFVQQWQYE